VDKLWSLFPRLALPDKYGEDLLERDAAKQVIVPENSSSVSTWETKKLRQYYVNLLGEDPVGLDDLTLRSRVGMQIAKRWHDRTMLDRQFGAGVFDTRPKPAPTLAPEPAPVRAGTVIPKGFKRIMIKKVSP